MQFSLQAASPETFGYILLHLNTWRLADVFTLNCLVERTWRQYEPTEICLLLLSECEREVETVSPSSLRNVCGVYSVAAPPCVIQ
jgi:hypothetical protein